MTFLIFKFVMWGAAIGLGLFFLFVIVSCLCALILSGRCTRAEEQAIGKAFNRD